MHLNVTVYMLSEVDSVGLHGRLYLMSGHIIRVWRKRTRPALTIKIRVSSVEEQGVPSVGRVGVEVTLTSPSMEAPANYYKGVSSITLPGPVMGIAQ